MTKSTSGGCDQFDTSPEAIEPELRTAFCERGQTDRQTDRLKTNYRIDTQRAGDTVFTIVRLVFRVYKIARPN